MKTIAALALTLLPLALPAQAKAPAPAQKALTGSYRRAEYGTIDVQALPDSRVHFLLTALAHIDAPGGPNLGTAEGTLTLHHGEGIYYADKPQTGRLRMTFTAKRVTITQKGTAEDLGFGYGVDATGVYRKISSKLPKFDKMR